MCGTSTRGGQQNFLDRRRCFAYCLRSTGACHASPGRYFHWPSRYLGQLVFFTFYVNISKLLHMGLYAANLTGTVGPLGRSFLTSIMNLLDGALAAITPQVLFCCFLAL